MKVHPSVTHERIMACAEGSLFGTEDDGICVACGEDQMGVEPDAERYKCEACGERQVYGGEQLVLLGAAG